LTFESRKRVKYTQLHALRESESPQQEIPAVKKSLEEQDTTRL
jgi:hypothetical protein